MRARWLMLGVLAACGSSASSTASSTTVEPSGPSAADREVQHAKREAARKAAIVAEHRKLESAHQDALGATCDDREKWAQQHCTPSCYPLEPRDPRAGTQLAGPLEIQHRVCQHVLPGDAYGPLQMMDELEPKLRAQPHRKRFPKPHAKTSWQAEIATWYQDTQPANKLPRGDVIAVVDSWRPVRHPITHERLRCVTVSHFTKSLRGKLDDCGASRPTACEANGNAAARGINVLHYRLAEATQLQAKGNPAGCQQAALAAIATSRGLPRWRQYAKLNVGEWKEGLMYRTRFDGIVDEDQLFEAATSLGAAAQNVYEACGGPATAQTTVEQEQSFHACP